MRATSNPEIEQALREVQAGSVDDYRTVVAAYHRRLRLWLAGFCPPGVDPDEIAHLAFLEAYRRIAHYQLGTDFFAWLCAFARNLVRAECEKIQRRARNNDHYLEGVMAEQQASALQAEGQDPEGHARFLKECLDLLKREARDLLNWRYGDGQRVQTIAQRLARSPSAVSVQLFGLRKILRDCVTRKMKANGATSKSAASYGTP